jgi:hypothetical protein
MFASLACIPWWFWVLVGVGVLLILGLIVAVVMRNSKESPGTSNALLLLLLHLFTALPLLFLYLAEEIRLESRIYVHAAESPLIPIAPFTPCHQPYCYFSATALRQLFFCSTTALFLR